MHRLTIMLLYLFFANIRYAVIFKLILADCRCQYVHIFFSTWLWRLLCMQYRKKELGKPVITELSFKTLINLPSVGSSRVFCWFIT